MIPLDGSRQALSSALSPINVDRKHNLGKRFSDASSLTHIFASIETWTATQFRRCLERKGRQGKTSLPPLSTSRFLKVKDSRKSSWSGLGSVCLLPAVDPSKLFWFLSWRICESEKWNWKANAKKELRKLRRLMNFTENSGALSCGDVSRQNVKQRTKMWKTSKLNRSSSDLSLDFHCKSR